MQVSIQQAAQVEPRMYARNDRACLTVLPVYIPGSMRPSRKRILQRDEPFGHFLAVKLPCLLGSNRSDFGQSCIYCAVIHPMSDMELGHLQRWHSSAVCQPHAAVDTPCAPPHSVRLAASRTAPRRRRGAAERHKARAAARDGPR
jgi:hypothetical protein